MWVPRVCLHDEGGVLPWQPPGSAPAPIESKSRRGQRGSQRSVLTPHLLRAMYHHLSLTERKLRPPTQLRTSSFPSPSTWEGEIEEMHGGVHRGCCYPQRWRVFTSETLWIITSEWESDISRYKHISHPNIAWNVATRSTNHHNNRVTLAITLPNVINKHVVLLIEKKKKWILFLKGATGEKDLLDPFCSTEMHHAQWECVNQWNVTKTHYRPLASMPLSVSICLPLLHVSAPFLFCITKTTRWERWK